MSYVSIRYFLRCKACDEPLQAPGNGIVQVGGIFVCPNCGMKNKVEVNIKLLD